MKHGKKAELPREMIGGMYNGHVIVLPAWQNIVYLPRRLSPDETEALKIDESVSWREPDEVYTRGKHGKFYWARTVTYKPDATTVTLGTT